MKGFIKIEDFVDYLKANDLIIAPRNLFKVLNEREKALRKRWLKVADIYNGQLWGDITKGQIRRIIKKLPQSEIRINQKGEKHFFEVRQSAVEITAKERGIL